MVAKANYPEVLAEFVQFRLKLIALLSDRAVPTLEIIVFFHVLNQVILPVVNMAY